MCDILQFNPQLLVQGLTLPCSLGMTPMTGACSKGKRKSSPPPKSQSKSPRFRRTKIFIDLTVTATTGESFSPPKHLLEETVKNNKSQRDPLTCRGTPRRGQALPPCSAPSPLTREPEENCWDGEQRHEEAGKGGILRKKTTTTKKKVSLRLLSIKSPCPWIWSNYFWLAEQVSQNEQLC